MFLCDSVHVHTGGMTEVVAVYMRAGILSISALAETSKAQYSEPCYMHAMFWSSWYTLVCIAYLLVWAAVCRIRDAVHGVLELHFPNMTRYSPVVIPKPFFTIVRPQAVFVQGSVVDDDMVQYPEDSNLMCYQDEPPAKLSTIDPQEQANNPGVLRERLMRNALMGATLFGSLTILQFHNVTGSLLFGSTFLIVRLPDACASRIMLVSTFMSAVSCTFILLQGSGDIQGTHLGSLFDIVLGAGLPVLFPVAISHHAGRGHIRSMVMDALPTMGIISMIVFLVGMAAEDICSVDIMSEWMHAYGGPGESHWTGIWKQGVLLALVWPVVSLLSFLVVLNGVLRRRCSEIGSHVITASCVRYIYTLEGNGTLASIGIASLLLSLVATTLIALHRAIGPG